MGADSMDEYGGNTLLSDDQIPSLMEIKKALPPHTFQSSVARSMSFVVKDLSIVTVLLLFAVYICTKVPVLFPLYWAAQGTMFWAIFVLGHDCGHSSFSRWNVLNDVLGTILHTGILVPFYSWKLSHRAHHKNTGNMDKDEIFYPVKADNLAESRVPLFEHLYFGLGLGWFYYLIFGYRPRSFSHFNPFNALYIERALSICCTLVAYSTWCGILAFLCFRLGFVFMVQVYFLPIFVFATWLVAVTFLHHNDNEVKWYSDSQWTYVKGNLSSVDRDYGWLHSLTHNIGTHQIHHLFPIIPHYHLEEATAAFRNAFPHLVRVNNEPIVPDFVRQFKIFARQHIIPAKTEVFQYCDDRTK